MLEQSPLQPAAIVGLSNHVRHRPVEARLHAKRVFDVCASLILIILILPLGCLITLVIALSGQFPFYSHIRVGRDRREFGCLKFRSMCRDADIALAQLLRADPTAQLEWENNRKLRDDPRVTRVGRFLRRTSLDELPQLLNILVGHMSFVGPRPVTGDELIKFYGPSEAAAYSSVRPGLTGLWQVRGRSESSYADRAALDTLYAQSFTLRTDLMILIQTIHVVVSKRGAW
jgi:exopolysaccharide production protein ExoY